MKFKVKKIPIYANVNVVVLNPNDARKLGIHVSDRVKIYKDGKEKIAIVDLDIDGKVVKEGEIGIFKNINEFNDGEEVRLELITLPESVKCIRKKIKRSRVR